MKFFKFIYIFLMFVQISFSQDLLNSELKTIVLKQLDLNEKEIFNKLYIEKILPYNKTISVIVIPKVAIMEDDIFAELDAYVLLVNNSNGAIISKYYKPKAWLVDAIYISSIEIDTANYQLNSKVKAFGIRVNYVGSSRVNPYNNTEISLFIQNGVNLNCILKNYEISKFNGEWDTNCEGEFESIESIIIVDKKKSNGYYNLKIKSSKVLTKNIVIEGDCEEKNIKEEKIIKYLMYNGKEYK